MKKIIIGVLAIPLTPFIFLYYSIASSYFNSYEIIEEMIFKKDETK